ncbi:MAG: GDP-mannose 4,6-dehydratase [Nitrospira sp.]|nr:GDP-mannose 4,6-dehydratase [Nitrospira sp.]
MRDVLHVEDLFELLHEQLRNVDAHSGQVYNVGGGPEGSLSLRELTELCRRATGKTIPIGSEAETRPGDVRIYLTDTSKVRSVVAWKPRWTVDRIVESIAGWIRDHEQALRPIIGGGI